MEREIQKLIPPPPLLPLPCEFVHVHFQKCIPARIKKIYMYNLGGFGDFVFMVMRLVMPEEIQKRAS